MKTQTLPASLLALALCGPALLATSTPARSPAVPDRIGVYDSRAVAYAHFWQPAESSRRQTQIAALKAAQAAGDGPRVQQLSRALKEDQAHAHLQVFSTAPADEAIAELAPRLPALQRELGVNRFVSQWDQAALRRFKTAERVDVTERLVHEFITPNARQQKVLDAMKTTKPLALWQAKVFLLFGRL